MPTDDGGVEHGGESASSPDGGSDSADPGDPGDPAHEPCVVVHLETTECDPPASAFLTEHLNRLIPLLDQPVASLAVVLVDDARMTELHGQYLNQPTTTDVLSFDLRDDDAAPIEGDLVLCVDEAARQATLRGHDTRLELLLYAVHGLLHFLGFDDHDPQDHAAMHAREDELLTRLGFEAVYQRGPVTP